MSLSFNPVDFNLIDGIVHWLIVVGAVIVVGGISMILMSVAALGMTGPLQVIGQVADGFSDLFGTSPRRVWALTVLTYREALRRKTLWVFAVFAILFLFAGWFMSNVTEDPELQLKAYVSFVLRTISWLIIPVVLLLSCWGLPEDIKARSLHTVVTKPVRRHEVVLGRIFGFSLIGAVVLAIMGVVGYVWIVRQMPESMQTQLIARVPIYGDLSFIDREGRDRDEQKELLKAGINVGDENPFRSFIEGSTKARAIWDFEKFGSANVSGPEDLTLESSFHAFRTHKGNMERGLQARYTLINPETKRRVPLFPFQVKEFRRNSYNVAEENKGRPYTDEEGKPVDLAKDILSGGKLQVEVSCLSSGQFIGMARPDLFIRLPDRSFAASYFKSVFSIGLMMVMVVVLGVTAGCFVKGPVATVLTSFIVIVGRLAHGFLEELATGVYKDNPGFEMKGRGILDSLIRIPTHQAPVVELEDTLFNRIVKAIDSVELSGLWAIQHVFPDLSTFDTTAYAANSFDVPWAASLLPSLAVTFGYCLPWFLIGYFSLKLRELEAK